MKAAAGKITGALRRNEVQWTIVPVIAAILLSLVPGFDILSFYFCLPMSLLLAMSAGSIMITAAGQGRARRDISAGIRRGFLHAALLPFGPLVVITVAHFINGPCDYLYGLTHFFAGPVLSSLTGAGTAACCVIATRRESRASALFIAIFVASFIPAAATLYFEPAVRFYNPFLGLYPGPIYDELIEVTPAYLTFRVWCLLLVAALWTTIRQARGIFVAPPSTGGITGRIPGWIVAGGLWALVALTLHGAGGFSFAIDRDDIADELSFVREDEFCRIHADSSWERRGPLIDIVLKDCGYRHRTMADFFGIPPGEPLNVWIYRDVEQKARLMGARHVEISKPWLNEIHVTDMMPGDMILAHEIAHVVAGRLADNPLAMPLTMLVIPDMAVVEGLAVAAAFADEGPSWHEWALAMIESGRDVDLESLFSPWSFISGGAAASYTTAGSFIRFVHDRYGTDAIRSLASGKRFVEATGKDLTELEREWRAFLKDTYSPGVDEILKARASARFSDPGVLHRRCPLDIARRLRDAMKLYDVGDLDAALEKIRQAERFDTDERSLKRLAARLDFLASGGLGDPAGMESAIGDVLSPPQGAATMADRTAASDLLILWGFSDIDATRGARHLERAASMLRDLRALLSPGGALRAVCARLTAIETGGEGGLAIVRALADPRPWTEGDADRLLQAAAFDSENAVLWHLTGRAAMSRGLFELARQAFIKADETGFHEPWPNLSISVSNAPKACVNDFTFENKRLAGISSYWAGADKQAREYLETAFSMAGFEGDRLVIREYLNRLKQD